MVIWAISTVVDYVEPIEDGLEVFVTVNDFDCGIVWKRHLPICSMTD